MNKTQSLPIIYNSNAFFLNKIYKNHKRKYKLKKKNWTYAICYAMVPYGMLWRMQFVGYCERFICYDMIFVCLVCDLNATLCYVVCGKKYAWIDGIFDTTFTIPLFNCSAETLVSCYNHFSQCPCFPSSNV